MKSLPASPRPLTIGIWLATASLTFCIGRFTSPGGPTAQGKPGVSVSKSSQAEDSFATTLPTNMSRSDASSGVDHASQTTEQLTGGRPIGEWLKKLLAQEDDIVRTTGFMRLLETLDTPEKIKAALEVAVPNGGGRGGWGRGMREYSMLLQKWTQLDPKSAANYAKNAKGFEDRFIATSSVLKTWARSNPEEALAWAQANAPATTANEGDQGGRWGGEGNLAVNSVITQLAHTNINRALEVASTQPTGRHSRLADSLVSELITQRGLEESRSAVSSLPAGSFRDSATAELAGRLAAKNAPETASWVMSLPQGEGRTRALSEVIDQWAKSDPATAGAYLTQLPATPENDPAKRSFAYNILSKDPEGAMAWAGSISDPDQRTRTVDSLARNWSRQDPKAAQAWATKNRPPVAPKQ